jgi:hypothetical protein
MLTGSASRRRFLSTNTVGVKLVEELVGGMQPQPDAGCRFAEVGKQLVLARYVRATV